MQQLQTLKVFWLLLVIVVCYSWRAPELEAQWKQIANVGKVNAITATDATLIIALDSGVLVSHDAGISWARFGENLPRIPITSLAISSAPAGRLLVGTMGEGVYSAPIDGGSFIPANLGIPSMTYVHSLTSAGARILAATYDGVEQSYDAGNHWTSASSGLGTPSVWSVLAMDTVLFAGTYQGVYRTENPDSLWVPMNDGLGSPMIYSMASAPGSLIVGTDRGIFVGSASSLRWTTASTADTNVFSLSTVGSTVLAGAEGTVQQSANAGATWKDISQGLPASAVLSLSSNSTTAYAGTASGLFARPLSEFSGVRAMNSNSGPCINSNFPNPFSSVTNLNITLKESDRIKITLLDLEGKELGVVYEGEVPGGNTTIRFSLPSVNAYVPAGIYQCRLTSSQGVSILPICVIR